MCGGRLPTLHFASSNIIRCWCCAWPLSFITAFYCHSYRAAAAAATAVFLNQPCSSFAAMRSKTHPNITIYTHNTYIHYYITLTCTRWMCHRFLLAWAIWAHPPIALARNMHHSLATVYSPLARRYQTQNFCINCIKCSTYNMVYNTTLERERCVCVLDRWSWRHVSATNKAWGLTLFIRCSNVMEP